MDDLALLIDIAFRAGFAAVFVVPGVLLLRRSERVWVRFAAVVGLIVLPVGWLVASAFLEVREAASISSQQDESESEPPEELFGRSEAYDLCLADGRIQGARYPEDVGSDWTGWCADEAVLWLYQHGVYVQDYQPASPEESLRIVLCHVQRGCGPGVIEDITSYAPEHLRRGEG